MMPMQEMPLTLLSSVGVWVYGECVFVALDFAAAKEFAEGAQKTIPWGVTLDWYFDHHV